MRRLSIFLAIAAAFTFGSCGSKNTKTMEASMNALSEAEAEQGWELLFDGKTTAGWRGHNKDKFPEKGWVIDNGTLHCIGSGHGEAGGGGDIIFDKKFDNFELSLEWKLQKGGNSGIFYLAREDEGQPIWKSAPEMQVLDPGHIDWNLGTDGNRRAGSLYDLISAQPQNMKSGDWNKVKITVFKGTVVHNMNGKNVLEYHLWTEDWKNMVLNSKFKSYDTFLNVAKSGYIGLQDHGDDVWYRNIKIRKM
ncbi:glycosyl hydrolase (plasmid) [Fulvitalea axinellae]|uniref:Glycosyl hydrolase n=1 Tax=Fulvitalea axinellae TaxID=1182444 RepID=A0AAU9DDD8_9BACT|nr:glycosyl hydrolase [Fulvitalea axinellae]